MKKRYILIISGKVQGVWYRKWAMQEAEKLNIKVLAQNLPTNQVKIDVEGEMEVLWQFIEACKIGPEAAEVTGIIITEEQL